MQCWRSLLPRVCVRVALTLVIHTLCLFCRLLQLDTVIDICSCLSTFSNLLKLRETPTLENLVFALTTASTAANTDTASGQTEERELEMDDNVPDSQLRSSILMLDNIHIRLTKVRNG